MAITKIPAAGFTGNNFRNIIINGDMSIAQRGTSTSSITGSGYHTLDRYQAQISSLGTWTISQSTDVPTGQGFGYSQKFDCTTANASPSSTSFMLIGQNIEGQNLQYLKKGTANAESTTLSFWVKSNKTGTYIAELQDTDNTRTIGKSYTIDSASTWEKKTITFAGDTTGAFDNDNAKSLAVNFYLGAGSNFTSGTLQTSWGATPTADRLVGQVNLADSTSNEFYITGVQLEVGSAASDFEFLPVDVNLQRCQRYLLTFGNTNNFVGHYYSNSQAVAAVYFPNKLRADPTVSCTNITNSIRVYSSNSLSNSSTFTDNGVTAEQGELIPTGATGTAGNGLTANINNSGFLLQFDAEL